MELIHLIAIFVSLADTGGCKAGWKAYESEIAGEQIT